MKRKKHLDENVWTVREEWMVKENMAGNESLFALANGFLGIRGVLEENTWAYHPGTYLNGFYDSKPIIYGETAYGFARNSQTMLNVADGRNIVFFLDEEPFDPASGTIVFHNRTLDLKRGVLIRKGEWKSPEGKSVRLTVERIVSFTRPHIAAIRYQVEPMQEGSTLKIVSVLDGSVRNLAAADDPRTGSHIGDAMRPFGGRAAERGGALRQRTRNSGLSVIAAVSHTIENLGNPSITCVHDHHRILFEAEGASGAGRPVTLCKYLSYYRGSAGDEERLEKKAFVEVESAEKAGFSLLAEEQETYLHDFWEHSDVRIEGDPSVQQSIRFNLFHLLQSVGKDGITSMAAKGLTGEGYEGHFFWDTEIYVLPFFIYTNPSIARKLLLFRHSILPGARTRASELNQEGALFPWRTINGEEASAYFPAGTAQYHINADIAFGIKKYLQVTGDMSFLPYAAEMLIETARMWVDLGDYIPKRGGAFCFNGVTGPDEYTALVNNNYYTNIMARDNLKYAAEAVTLLMEKNPEVFKTLARELSFSPDEMEKWAQAAEAIYLPYDEEGGINCQDDSFLLKRKWFPEDIPAEKRPILLHYHPLVIYRYQIIKQADLILAEFLQGEHFSQGQKRRDFNYYDPLTTGDSSLSACVQGVMAAEIGCLEKAYDYFTKTARIDLDDLNGNVKDGVHTAAMAGTWISLVYGFAGMRDYGGIVRFTPALPNQWQRLTFTIMVSGTLLEVTITQDEAAYRIKDGEEIALMHEGKPHRLAPGAPLVFSLQPALEAVIFDLDGVITDSAEYHFKAWDMICRELEIPFDRKYNEKLKGVSRMASLELLLSLTDRRFSQEEKQILGARKNEYYKELILQVGPEDLLPGIADFIEELKKAGIKTGLASASRNAGTLLDLLRIRDVFDVITEPESLRKGKPDPEQFFTAAEYLKVPFRNCVGIEDAQAGVEAIKGAGMFALGIGEYLYGADWICKDTTELKLEDLRARFFSRQ